MVTQATTLSYFYNWDTVSIYIVRQVEETMMACSKLLADQWRRAKEAWSSCVTTHQEALN